MATYRGLRLPPTMITQMKNVVVKKSVDLTSYLDRGSVADAVTDVADAGCSDGARMKMAVVNLQLEKALQWVL